ncbi:MAG: hypothetical protein PV340_00425 [Wolbachia sp.]|nr:hypothetical protein [Wolbachia sp.]MDD9336347.1 hypothetical protein [Wolbachia sp.]
MQLLNGAEKQLNNIANNLFWSTFFRNGKKVENILEASKKKGYLAQILQIGCVELLYISIAREIQQRSAEVT